MFTRKDRKIANLTAMVENRDKLIGDQLETIKILRQVINSLEDDLSAIREEAYKTAKKPTTRKKAK